MRVLKIILLIAVFTLPFQAYSAENIRKITVSGKSEITLEAQSAIINLEIKHVKQTMNQSHAELVNTFSKLRKNLLAEGLSDKDVTESLISQGPEYRWEKDSQVLKGYYSQCVVELSINDLKKLAGIYEELANYPSVTIQSTDYKRKDEFEIRKKEFEKALLAAKNKAEYMAQILNAKIGKVHSIQEINSENYFAEAYSNVQLREEKSVGLKGYGNIKITAQVSVEFELE